MKVDIKPNKEQSEVTLKVVVTGDELAPYVKKAAAKLTEDKPLKGFRPGKAPVEVVEEAYGSERIMHDVVDAAVPQFFVKAAQEEEIDAIAQPKITVEKLDRKEGMEFTAIVAVLPEVELGDLSKIEVEKRVVEVNDEDVEKELKVLAKMRSTFLDVARPAKEGDTVRVDFKISMNGTMLEGGESKDHPIHLGEGQFLPDFEKKLEGILAGDEREFDISFPDDYGKKEFAGKVAQAWVKANAVQQRAIPKIDDELAKTVGKFKNIEALRKSLKENMGEEKQQKERDRWQSGLTEKLAEGATFGHIPEVLIEKEIDRNLEELSQMLAMQQKTLEDYVKESGKDAAAIREEMKPNAEKRVRVGLALRKFTDDADLVVEESELEEKVNEYLQRFPSAEEAEKSIDPEELKEQLSYMIKNQKALEELEKKVTVKEVKEEKKVASKKESSK